MQLTNLTVLNGTIKLVSGLHIGGSNTEMHIGGTDNSVVKNPLTHEPYIPGSSLKGKMRSLLEWQLGLVSTANGKPFGFAELANLQSDRDTGVTLVKLFGGAPTPNTDDKLVREIGPTRLSFWDAPLNAEWLQTEIKNKQLLMTEVKTENMIDRIKGTAENPRNTERVPAGSEFDFKLTIRQHDQENLTDMIFQGLRLLELTGLGGSGSRGYGKIRFVDLQLNGEPVQQRLDAVNFGTAA